MPHQSSLENESYCILCKKIHTLGDCPDFAGLNVDGRMDVCFKNRVCFKCLKIGHQATKCAARIRCLTCGGPHSSWLHNSTPPAAKGNGRQTPAEVA